MEPLIRFMNGPIGRAGRFALGVALIVAGFRMGGPTGVLVALVGLIPIGLGGTGRCMLELFRRRS